MSRERSSALRREALRHLEKSVEHGFDDLEALEHDTDLDPLRDMEGFRAILADLKGSKR